MRVWWHNAKRTLAASIRHLHTGPSPGMMVLGVIGYASRSLLVRTDRTLNRTRYFSGVFRHVALHFIRVLRNPTFQQNNTQPHVAGIAWSFLDWEKYSNVFLLKRSPDI
ncbi:uncharacterized protein TNCV_467921 [Trichonephila clavipes]|nr:uncharacterized protein TNCV_467921 [Trichonephila clavipes]